jgi:L-threonylcarbamoyladenylate synthase
MKHTLFKIDPEHPDKALLHKAVKILSRGGIIVYPTDTLYGLGASTSRPEAMDRLFALKGRSGSKPVSLMVNSIAEISKLAGSLNQEEIRLAGILFPGKITLLIPVRQKIAIKHMEHLHRIGFRIPDSPVCRHLVELNGAPVTTTSANRTEQENLRTAEEIAAVFEDQVDLIIDAGPIDSRHGSSVLDISFSPPVLVREGDISRSRIEEQIGYPVNPDYPDKYLITFVCSGNICRSPMAVGILNRALLKTKYRDQVNVQSAGTLNLPRTPAALEALDVSEEKGIDLNNHLSQPVNPEIIRQSDLVICMALNHYNHLVTVYPGFRDKIVLLRQWGKETLLSNPSIADPIGQPRDYFRRIFDEIEREIQRVLPEISRRVKEFIRTHPRLGNF